MRARKLNFVVVGAGNPAAEPYIAALEASRAVEIVGGVEPDLERMRQVREEHGFPVHQSMPTLAATKRRVDLALVCVPPASYQATVGRALTICGWNVVAPYPRVDGNRLARLLHDQARISGRFLLHVNPRTEMTPRIDELVAKGEIGKVRRAEVRWTRAGRRQDMASRLLMTSAEVAILSVGTHALRFAVGSDRPVVVQCRTRAVPGSLGAGPREEGVMRVELDGGLRAVTDGSQAPAPAGSRAILLIVGETAEIEAELDAGDSRVQVVPAMPAVRRRVDGTIRSTRLRRLRTAPECYAAVVAQTVHVFRHRTAEHDVAVRQELELLRLMDAARQALTSGQVVRVVEH
jgi:predicted dehydrogenase